MQNHAQEKLPSLAERNLQKEADDDEVSHSCWIYYNAIVDICMFKSQLESFVVANISNMNKWCGQLFNSHQMF